jgi:hypothetical protein
MVWTFIVVPARGVSRKGIDAPAIQLRSITKRRGIRFDGFRCPDAPRSSRLCIDYTLQHNGLAAR